jgi:hypothetical protein
MVPVDPESLRVLRQLRLEQWILQVADDRGGDEADLGIAVIEVALDPAHEVVGTRLHFLGTQRAVQLDRGRLPRSECLEQAEGPARLAASGELRRADDLGRVGHVGVLGAVRQVALGLPSDPSRIEHPEVRDVGAEIAAEVTEAEDTTAFDEEGTPLREERLERREVHDRGIHLDLAEVLD